jgi:hypothetical protein
MTATEGETRASQTHPTRGNPTLDFGREWPFHPQRGS